MYFVSIFDPTVTKATTLSEKDSIRAQIGQGWSLPIGLPINLNMFARIKIELKPDGTYLNVELIDDGQEFDEVFLDSISRALEQAQPLKVPKNNYEMKLVSIKMHISQNPPPIDGSDTRDFVTRAKQYNSDMLEPGRYFEYFKLLTRESFDIN